MQIKLITSNIRFSNKTDGNHCWQNRLPILSKLINDFSPLILGTQEGKQVQINEFALTLTDLTLIDKHRNWLEERMYPALFINTSFLEVIESGDIWLSATPHIAGSISFQSAFPRLCTWAKLKVKAKNQEILVCNTHLDHVYETTREQQISVLIDQLQLVNKSNLPIILMGDFNEGPNGKVRSQINSKLPNLIDPWDAVESGSHHKFDGNNKNSLRIDWILIDKIFKKEKIYLEQSHENNIYPSDHFPVKCILNF
ncbi:MAG: endonuclease/exonuclease/phosphatase family protein [Bdellovibrionales bacterium]|nr:endonuclease/exonuclease/phosphatase family protein [Bdellovibrionales bacterium]